MGVYLYIYSIGYRGLVGMNRIGWAPYGYPPSHPLYTAHTLKGNTPRDHKVSMDTGEPGGPIGGIAYITPPGYQYITPAPGYVSPLGQLDTHPQGVEYHQG